MFNLVITSFRSKPSIQFTLRNLAQEERLVGSNCNISYRMRPTHLIHPTYFKLRATIIAWRLFKPGKSTDLRAALEEESVLAGEKRHKFSYMKMGSYTRSTIRYSKQKFQYKSFGGYLKEQRGRLYIARRCIVMLLCWED